MRFKEFMRLEEEQGGGDKGLMGFNTPSSIRKPSDGQPFKDKLSPIAGQTPRGGGGGGGGAPAGAPMMRKQMKKK